ncbi:hypothetical protein Tco_1120315 [Tanacetum coccineum]
MRASCSNISVLGKEIIPPLSSNFRCLLKDASVMVLACPSMLAVSSTSPLIFVLEVAVVQNCLINKAYMVRFSVRVISMDKSKITRKQSKSGQTRTQESEEYKAKAKSLAISSFMKPQGPILQIPKVIYNLKKGKEREGQKLQTPQTPTVLTVEIRAPKVLLFTFLPRFTSK